MNDESQPRGFQNDLLDRTNDAPVNVRKSYTDWRVIFAMIPIGIAALGGLCHLEKKDQRASFRYLQQDIAQLAADRQQGYYNTAARLESDLADSISELEQDRPFYITSNEVSLVKREFDKARYLPSTNQPIKTTYSPKKK